VNQSPVSILAALLPATFFGGCGPSSEPIPPSNIDMPELTISWLDADATDDGNLLISLVIDPAMAAIIDREGTVLWARVSTHDEGDPLTTHAILGPGKGEVSFNAFSSNVNGGGEDATRLIIGASLFDSTQTEVNARFAHHDFTPLPDGSLAWIAYDNLTASEWEHKGDQVLERSPDGSIRTVWSSWDHYQFVDGHKEPDNLTWTHANALSFDEDRDEYLLGLRTYGHIIGIDRSTGQINWTFGEDGDFTLAAGSVFPTQQHHFQLLEDELIVFDNGPRESLDSNAVSYVLDWEALTATEIWRYSADPDIYSFGLGDVDRLPNGNTLVTFGSAGQIDEVTPEGEVVWRLNTDLGSALGYVETVDELSFSH
jgi:hypothetical protein